MTEWLTQHDELLSDASLEAGAVGRLRLVLVQKGRAYDEELSADAADLEADLANDDRFGLLRIDVLIAPGPKMAEG